MVYCFINTCVHTIKLSTVCAFELTGRTRLVDLYLQGLSRVTGLYTHSTSIINSLLMHQCFSMWKLIASLNTNHLEFEITFAFKKLICSTALCFTLKRSMLGGRGVKHSILCFAHTTLWFTLQYALYNTLCLTPYPPPPSVLCFRVKYSIFSTFFSLPHHALLHKGLVCRRSMINTQLLSTILFDSYTLINCMEMYLHLYFSENKFSKKYFLAKLLVIFI